MEHFHRLTTRVCCSFKLWLSPDSQRYREGGFNLDNLPPGKVPTDIISDYFAYLLECTEIHLRETLPNYRTLLSTFKKDCDFVITHPNDWGDLQRRDLLTALCRARKVADQQQERFNRRVQFVTEGEASLYACLSEMGASLKVSGRFIPDIF